jgi:hypothetical protein
LKFRFIYLDLQVLELESEEWVELANGREEWRALLSTVMSFEVAKMLVMY